MNFDLKAQKILTPRFDVVQQRTTVAQILKVMLCPALLEDFV